MKGLFIEYDDILIGKRTSFSDRYFGSDRKKNMEHALIVMRYAFREYLRWSPEAIKESMTRDIMEKLHLQGLMKYVIYPIEYDKEKDYYYLASLVFHHYKLSMRDKTIHTYEKIINGELSKYPKDYFTGSDGIVRAGICLQYLINHYIIFRSMNELYHIFASETGYQYLRNYKLLNVCREIFETPVDFLNFAIPKNQRNDFYYYYYRFKFSKEMKNEKGRKRRSEEDYLLRGKLA